MSATPASRTRDDFGVALVLDCVSCGELSFTAVEADRARRMQEFHDSFCGGATLERRRP